MVNSTPENTRTGSPSASRTGEYLDVIQIVERFAPRQWKENGYNEKNRYSMACPLPDHADTEHPDHSGSFSVDAGRKVWFCHGCGRGGGRSSLYKALSGQAVELQEIPRPAPRPKPQQSPKPRAKPSGIALAEYVEAKAPTSEQTEFRYYLESDLAWKDANWYGTPALEMPYLGMSDQTLATRFRVGLTGDRFRWQPGSSPQLYGLQKLPFVKQCGRVLIVEGESDFSTLDYLGFPVLAVPGASTWDPQWAWHIRGLDVYLWQEPDQGGDTLLAKLLESNVTCHVIAPKNGPKDANALWIELGNNEMFRTALESLMDLSKLVMPQREKILKADIEELPEGTIESRKAGYKRDRDQLVHGGLWLMYRSDSDENIRRISQEVMNAIDGVDRCMVRAAYQRYVGEQCRSDVAKAVASIPCKGLGHERCVWQHLESTWKRDRGAKVEGNFVNLEKLVNHAYGEARINVLWLGATTDNYRAFNDWQTLLYKRRPIAQELAWTFSAPQATAYGWKTGLMLTETADAEAIAATWREIAGEQAVVDMQPTDPKATPAEIGLELVCQGKQAIPILVATGELTPEEGLDRLDDCYRKAEYHLTNGKEIAEDYLQSVSASNPSIRKPKSYIDVSDAPQGTKPPESQPCLCNVPGCQLKPKGKPVHWSKFRGKINSGQLVELDDGELLVSPVLAAIIESRREGLSLAAD